MCAPGDDANSAATSTTTKHVVVVGAGPSGLLLSNLLLYRNKNNKNNNTDGNKTTYRVTLIDSRVDVGRLDVETELVTKYKSWMIALAGHGLDAIRTIPGLYENYVSKPHVGVRLTEFGLFLGSTKMGGATVSSEDNDATNADDQEAHVVDRNFVVAALAKYMDDEYGQDKHLTRLYETSLQYVDSNNKRVLVKPNPSASNTENNKNNQQEQQEQYIDYDILIGADGARSVVRDCFVRDVYEFETDFGDIFHCFRAVHVTKPPSISPSGMYILPEIFPNMAGIVLPMPNNMSNISIGTPRHTFDAIPSELKSDDVTVVSKYVREHFKAFELADYDEFAQAWINNKRWNRTSMVHCNTYHNTKGCALLMGDACHATSPSIGMGMNTALRDAQKLYELIEEYNDDWSRILPEYSIRRVPEGNSLTDMAYHLYCFDTTTQLLETIHMVVRSKLHTWFPTWISNHPQAMIGQSKYTLAYTYDLSTKLNIIPKHRPINDRIRREFFEREVGMVQPTTKNTTSIMIVGVVGVACLSVIVGYGMNYTTFPTNNSM